MRQADNEHFGWLSINIIGAAVSLRERDCKSVIVDKYDAASITNDINDRTVVMVVICQAIQFAQILIRTSILLKGKMIPKGLQNP